LLQPPFETPDGGTYYIETHDKNYCGHFRLRRVKFTPEILSIEFDRPMDNVINVTFDMTIAAFKKASRVVKTFRQLESPRWPWIDSQSGVDFEKWVRLTRQIV
jgi:hypothetical protein